jgi:AcrR family transcriptional regulator
MAAHNGQTKAKIAEAAIRLILDEGFGAATVVRIRAAAGVSNGSFYAAFGTRDKLFDHLLGVIEASHRPALILALAHPARSARDGTWARPLMSDGTIRPMPDLLLHALVLGNADAVARHSDAVVLEVSADAMASVLAEAGWVAIRSRAEHRGR